MERSASYTLRFAAIVGVVASSVVGTAAVVLASRQEENRLLDRRARVLDVAGLAVPGERLSRAEVTRRFEQSVRPVVVELATGEAVSEGDPSTFDQRRAARDPLTSRLAPANTAGVSRLPERVLVFHVIRDGALDALVLPFEGVGLWSTMYGYVALSADLSRVLGITFYEHAETAGLGAQVSDPEWRALWVGRRMFDDDGEPALRVVKGRAPPADEAPLEVDGISGATLTGNGVTRAL
ncbi:MAG TPA: NADH:ubiquinone reductase (Na(+)-transporting) subunit C, partial [Longimicrobiales bacterium]|nr:NADH:ubiquinone reductase (Na(+)-transporting) subunit C [Longimicrobiales bacterium]